MTILLLCSLLSINAFGSVQTHPQEGFCHTDDEVGVSSKEIDQDTLDRRNLWILDLYRYYEKQKIERACCDCCSFLDPKPPRKINLPIQENQTTEEVKYDADNELDKQNKLSKHARKKMNRQIKEEADKKALEEETRLLEESRVKSEEFSMKKFLDVILTNWVNEFTQEEKSVGEISGEDKKEIHNLIEKYPKLKDVLSAHIQNKASFSVLVVVTENNIKRIDMLISALTSLCIPEHNVEYYVKLAIDEVQKSPSKIEELKISAQQRKAYAKVTTKRPGETSKDIKEKQAIDITFRKILWKEIEDKISPYLS